MDVAANLNELCRQVVAASHSDDPGESGRLARDLEIRAAGEVLGDPVSGLMQALAKMLRGASVADVEALVPPAWGRALRAVAADLGPGVGSGDDPIGGSDVGGGGAGGSAAPVQPDDDETPSRALPEWVMPMTAVVAAALLDRDQAAAERSDATLETIATADACSDDEKIFAKILRSALSGEDVRARVVGLGAAYREALLSLDALLRGEDPRAGLISRVVQNAQLVIRSGDPEARAALSSALAALEARAAGVGQPEMARFAALVTAEVGLRGPGADARFEEPDLQDAWAAISAAGTSLR